MLEVATAQELTAHIDQAIGTSEWVTVDQAMINAFADATGDHQWIHLDVERAKRDIPGGKTIAHGFLTLSLLPRLSQSVLNVRQRTHTLNYGTNRVRFTAPVPSGSRVRLHMKLISIEPVPKALRLTFENTVEIEGQDKPALVAETIQVTYT
ncbi:MAG TPA: MaoC family dehydratase [Magnetospirillaceae bacterium]|jgi:acyl dehydratase